MDRYLKNNGFISKIRYSSRNNKYYLLCFPYWGFQRDTVRIYEYDRQNLRIIYNEENTRENRSIINTIDGFIYIRIGKQINRYIRGNYELMFEVTDENFGGQVWGRNKSDIVIRMFNGLAHYNGTDIQYILTLPDNIHVGNGLILNDDFFLVTYDNNTGFNIIYHGILNKE